MLALALARSILAELVLASTKTGLRGHEGIIGKDAGDLWPYSREGGSKQAFQDFKTGCLQDQCPTLSLPVLLLRGLDPGAEEGPLTRKLGS